MGRDYKVSIKRKKGSVLILMLAVIAMILVLGTSLIIVNTSTYKVQVVNDTVSRVNYMAKSGIQVALEKTNKTDFHFVSNDNSDDIINCHVEFQEDKPDSNHYTIVSTASKGSISKTMQVIRTKEPTSKTTFNFLDFVFSVIQDNGSNCFNYPNSNGNRSFSFTGPVFLQGVSLSGNKHFSIDVNATAGTNNGIVTTNLINTSNISASSGINKMNVKDLKTPMTVKTNIGSIGDPPNFDGYTLVVNNGDMTIAPGNYDKQIIYCDGVLNGDGNGNKDSISFTNSIIFCKGFNADSNAFKNFTVTYPSSLDNATKIAVFNKISTYLN
jgi:hypothetical protein